MKNNGLKRSVSTIALIGLVCLSASCGQVGGDAAVATQELTKAATAPGIPVKVQANYARTGTVLPNAVNAAQADYQRKLEAGQ